MGYLRSLKLAAALVVVSLVAGMIHPDTRAGLLAGWRPSMEQKLKGVDPDSLSNEAKIVYSTAQFPTKENSEAIAWRSDAVKAALDSNELVLKGIAARVTSLPPTDQTVKKPEPTPEFVSLSKSRQKLMTQGADLDSDNAFWWLELAIERWNRGDAAAAEDLVIRASSCSSYNDFAWAEVDVRRRVYVDILGSATENELIAETSAIIFPHISAHRGVFRLLLVGRSFSETAKLRLALARLGLLIADDSQTVIGQLAGSSTHRMSLVQTAPGETRLPLNPKYFSESQAEKLFAKAGHENDRSWRVMAGRKVPTLPQDAMWDLSPIVTYGPTIGYASTWRALLCGIVMGLGLWLARRWADSGWLNLVRPGLAAASIAGIIITFGTPENSMLVVVAVLSASVISALCLAYRRAHVLFPAFALVAPQVPLASDYPFFPDQLLAFIGSLAAIGSYFLAWKPEHKASKWIASTLPLFLLTLAVFVGMRMGNYSSEYDHGDLGNPLHRTVSEPAFTPVFYWSLGFTVLATLACLQKERVIALAQAKSVATFTAILVASSVVYTGVMEAQSRDAIRQFKSETRHLEAQLGEALRKADYPSPAANNPAWKR